MAIAGGCEPLSPRLVRIRTKPDKVTARVKSKEACAHQRGALPARGPQVHSKTSRSGASESEGACAQKTAPHPNEMVIFQSSSQQLSTTHTFVGTDRRAARAHSGAPRRLSALAAARTLGFRRFPSRRKSPSSSSAVESPRTSACWYRQKRHRHRVHSQFQWRWLENVSVRKAQEGGNEPPVPTPPGPCSPA